MSSSTRPKPGPRKTMPRLYSRVETAHKAIRLRPQHPQAAAKIAEMFALSGVASRIMAARGFKADDKLRQFLSPTLKDGLPCPDSLKNIGAACELIRAAGMEQKAIAVCCDFDVDGLSGGAQLKHFFNCLGYTSFVYVPDRFADGYGLNEKMVREIAARGCGLLVAIDFGTTNTRELQLARELGLKSIVVDHHHVPVNPPADVFINPQQDGCGFAEKLLCASGLTWYLIAALRRAIPAAESIDPKSYLDLACLGTICDMVPLIGANRVLAKRGLEALAASRRPGLVALKNIMGLNGEVGCADVSFGIGPRLNAAGRIVHGEVVIELLTTEDSAVAQKHARKLNRLNQERQEIENQVKERAVKIIEQQGYIPPAMVVCQPDFHTGVIGIVAQRLVENFYRPAAVIGVDNDGVLKGSVRGIKGFSVIDALTAAGEHLLKYGGHEGAGGFALRQEQYDDFAAAFIAESARQLANLETAPYAEADTEVTLNDITFDLVEELRGFAPFGMGNPGPLLLVKDLQVLETKEIKSAHLKAMLSDGKLRIPGLLWRQKKHPAVVPGARVNIVFKADYSNWNGMNEIQATLHAVESAVG